MTSSDALKTILDEQVKGYRTLLELLQKERNCLIDLNAAGIEELSKEKDTVILKLRLLEEERMRLINKFYQREKSLRDICHFTGDRAFLEIRSKLLSLLQSIDEMNQFNRILIERSLHHIKNRTAFLNSVGMKINSSDKGTLITGEI
ncbi:MAG: flagellar protein FlgN [Nitrospirae bacterium]|nr:flagellar protein FlgN [Nitrospirota bacterium]